MGVVCVAFLVNILLLSGALVEVEPASAALSLAGWGVMVVGAMLVGLSLVTLRRRGTEALVRSGVYGVVRHPMYVGGMVMFLAHALLGQHWAIAVGAAAAIGCSYMLVRSEDLRLTERFGDRYTEYMRAVPGLNFLAGMARAARRR